MPPTAALLSEQAKRHHGGVRSKAESLGRTVAGDQRRPLVVQPDDGAVAAVPVEVVLRRVRRVEEAAEAQRRVRAEAGRRHCAAAEDESNMHSAAAAACTCSISSARYEHLNM